VQASLVKTVIAVTATCNQKIVICFPTLQLAFDHWSSLALPKRQITEESEYNPPDQAFTWIFHFTQIQNSTASVARQFFAVALKSPKQAINNSRCAKHTAATIRLIQLCWTMFGKWTSAACSTCRWHCTSSSPWTCKKPNKSISESEHKI